MSADPATFPRDPSAFRPTPHFTERYHDRYGAENRHLDGDIVAGCIEDGTATEADANGIVYLRETFAGATYRLVVDVDDREVVTGYPLAINTEAAKQSSRWTTTQVEEIHAFVASGPP